MMMFLLRSLEIWKKEQTSIKMYNLKMWNVLQMQERDRMWKRRRKRATEPHSSLTQKQISTQNVDVIPCVRVTQIDWMDVRVFCMHMHTNTQFMRCTLHSCTCTLEYYTQLQITTIVSGILLWFISFSSLAHCKVTKWQIVAVAEIVTHSKAD